MHGFKSPEEVIRIFVEGWNAKNAEKLASIFVTEAEFVNVTGLWWHNKERIYKAHEYGLRVIFKDSPLRVLYLRKRQLTSEVVMIHAKMQLENQAPIIGVTKTSVRNNILLFICKQYDSGWLCEAVQNTEIMLGQETFVVDEEGNRSAVNYGQYGS